MSVCPCYVMSLFVLKKKKKICLSVPHKMILQRKTKPPPLHVSQARIHVERVNVILRTKNQIASWHAAAHQNQIASLNATAHQNQIVSLNATTQWHSCLNIICFCMLLVVVNLLFLQWLHYNTNNVKQL
jgi:hypothetical protein